MPKEKFKNLFEYYGFTKKDEKEYPVVSSILKQLTPERIKKEIEAVQIMKLATKLGERAWSADERKKKKLLGHKTKESLIKILFKIFEQEYINYYQKKVEEFRNKYSEISNPNRRTGRALKNICFFIWYYTQGEKSELFNVLFKTSVLLSAQDDFCDNPRVSNSTKQEFYSICNDLLEGEKNIGAPGHDPQFQEIIALWGEIVKEMKKYPSPLYNYWKESAKQLNEAMKKEGYKPRNYVMPLAEYMKVATHSIGAVFIWLTYFIIKKVPLKTLKMLEPSLLSGAVISRLSNDIASYREKKNKINAVNLITDKKNPEKYIATLIQKEKQKLKKNLIGLDVENWIKETIERSTEFLIEVYKKSDFTKNILNS